MTIRWCMVLRYGERQTSFCHFGLFFALLPPPCPKQPRKSNFWKNEENNWRYYHFKHMYHKWKSYVWFLRYGAWQNFFSFWTIFCTFSILTTQKFKTLKKWKDIILHKCTISDNHMMYGSSDMKHDRQNFLLF